MTNGAVVRHIQIRTRPFRMDSETEFLRSEARRLEKAIAILEQRLCAQSVRARQAVDQQTPAG